MTTQIRTSTSHPYHPTSINLIAGENIPAGTIDVQWQESGLQPLIKDLSGYTLSLMTGGDDGGNMLPLTQFVSQGNFDTGYKAGGTIPAGIAEAVDNGFFFRIVSTAEAGGTVINYSSRFNITGLQGATPLQYRQAAASLIGATTGPHRVVNVAGLTSDTTNTTSQSSNMNSNGTDSPASVSATIIASTSSTTSLSSPSATLPSSAAPRVNGFSTGVIAGIAVGCSLAGIGITVATAVAIVFRRRRRQHNSDANTNSAFLDGKAELCADGPEPRSPSASELGTEQEVVEADDGLTPPELDPMSVRAELE
ncbi:Cell wall synthesis protein kre9 precursor [Recurvomyces mirabilis]|uniref:Cell wall synthesis protein kre9 n=1 Tax=Recurvomyces mirabilis TaxID=574656 RepID=A0AAE0WX53_9PEZI|nr:Cell wall synthesis protein kre9 precursor [Recurvomyces mirabilis]KAK5159046.1 Cell wall synthesis protein kre9 precursor [Recurvomyces mirabilis]